MFRNQTSGEAPPAHANPLLDTALELWQPDPWLLVPLALVVMLYALGVALAWRHAGVGRGVSIPRAAAGAAALFTLVVALATPLEALAVLSFSAHMVQHLLIALVAAPLAVAAVPIVPALWLLPPANRKGAVSAWRRAGPLRKAYRVLIDPLVASVLFGLSLWAWHLPAAYEGALANPLLHALEHWSMFAAAALFWQAVIGPAGGHRRRLAGPLMLFGAALHGGILGMIITVAPEPWYGHYVRVAGALGTSALADQQLAGLLMWVPPGALYLLGACLGLYRIMGRSMRLRGGIVSGVVATLALTGGGRAQVLAPSGPAAQGIATLFNAMVVIAALVCLLVFILLAFALFLPRRRPRPQPPLGTGPFVVLGGIVLPVVVLVPLLLWSLALTADLVTPTEEPVTIEVVGHQFWWEVRYPEHGVVDANEIHIPVGVPVRLELTSVDVIHSLWIPGLQGKLDLIPGQTNTLWVEAAEAGVHPAKCAEFCGVQHANMQLLVVSQPRAGFETWLAARQETPATPSDPVAQRGQQIFLGSACVYCHTVRGTNATSRMGPDLTHIAGRLTLGAGTIANNRGNLAGWIVNSQALKPGNRMPPMYLDSADLHALVTYLESLR